ncbi:hypothetical protein [Chroococcidiopsis sp. CCMEE 29]|nr:hypothetical protein [Chroococcidiopsis sp. CCMEE 29]
MSDEERERKLKKFFEIDWEGKEDFIKTMEQLEKEKMQHGKDCMDTPHK